MTAIYQHVKRYEKLSIQVAEQIVDLIVEGKLKTGERLPPERELSKLFNVSRTVVREAVSNLEAKGLVFSVTGSGSYVQSLQSEHVSDSLGLYINTNRQSFSIMDLLEVRRVIESKVAYFAAERATEDDILALENVLHEMNERTDDPLAFAKKDLEFHVILARTSGNPIFEMVLKSLTDVMLQFIYISSELPGTPAEACRYHQEVVDTIKTGDPEKATEAILNHLQQTERVTIKGLRRKVIEDKQQEQTFCQKNKDDGKKAFEAAY